MFVNLYASHPNIAVLMVAVLEHSKSTDFLIRRRALDSQGEAHGVPRDVVKYESFGELVAKPPKPKWHNESTALGEGADWVSPERVVYFCRE